MGRAFDIERPRPRTTAPSVPPKRHGSSGGWLFGLILTIAIVTATLSQSSQGETNPSMSPTLSTEPSLTRTFTTPTPTALSPSPVSLTPTSTPSAPEPSPTPTPTPTIEKSSITMSILNASGTAGKARELRDILLRDGFTTRRIATTTPQRETTLIAYQAGKRAEADLVASFIPDRVLEFEENSTLANPDTIVIYVGRK